MLPKHVRWTLYALGRAMSTVTPFLRRIAPETAERLKPRVAAEITTTFVSHYTKVVSLAGALEPEEIAQYSKRATGQKYLIDPTRA